MSAIQSGPDEALPPRLLVVDDDVTVRLSVRLVAEQWGYAVTEAADGDEAVELHASTGARLVVTDWAMPNLDGSELCGLLRRRDAEGYTYIIMLTARDDDASLVAGLEAGADDFVRKPFVAAELKARLATGRRIVELQQSLASTVAELTNALGQVKTLEGILPICMFCRKIRDDDDDTWQRLDMYLAEHTDAMISHGLCPECEAKHYP